MRRKGEQKINMLLHQVPGTSRDPAALPPVPPVPQTLEAVCPAV